MPKLATFRAKRDSASGFSSSSSSSFPTSILHVDMDAFFVSVELLDRPELRGKPVVVRRTAGSARHCLHGKLRGAKIRNSFGDAAAHRGTTVPARSFSNRGITSLLPNGATGWRRSSENIRRSWKWLRSRGVPRPRRDGTLAWTAAGCSGCAAARNHGDDGLPCSAGLARTRLVAKVASDQAKPRGLVWVPAGSEEAFLAPLDVRRIPGIGKVTEAALKAAGAEKVGQLACGGARKTRTGVRPMGHGAVPQSARRRHLSIFRGCGTEIYFA